MWHMSYKINGHEITVNFPVDSISVNKTSIAFPIVKVKTDRLFQSVQKPSALWNGYCPQTNKSKNKLDDKLEISTVIPRLLKCI